MRIVDIREHTVPISRYADPAIASGGLTTSVVAVETDVRRGGKPVVGLGFASIGRFGQGGLIRERFAPRLLAAEEAGLLTEAGDTLDPLRAWQVMMRGEKPGGHGERCVAVGTLEMALWDAAAKLVELPLHRHLTQVLGAPPTVRERIPVYAGGGYPYPQDDTARLQDEVKRMLDLGYTRVKIKIGSKTLVEDLARIEAVCALLPSCASLAVDAMNRYSADACLEVAAALKPFGLWWFEDICDPLDLAAHRHAAERYPHPIAAGEALFSEAEAVLLDAHAGLRRDQDILLFDPVHCYGLPGYLRIVRRLTDAGWPLSAFWPHGGHLFCQHLVQALGLGGAELNPLCFPPFGGLVDGAQVSGGETTAPELPGIGFEGKANLLRIFLDTVL